MWLVGQSDRWDGVDGAPVRSYWRDSFSRKKTGRRTGGDHKVTPGLQRRVHLEYLSGGSHPLPPLGDADVLRIILYTKSQNPRSTGVSLRPAKLQRKIAVNQGGVWTHGPAERKADVPFYMFAIKVKTSISNAAASILCLCLPKDKKNSLLHK